MSHLSCLPLSLDGAGERLLCSISACEAAGPLPDHCRSLATHATCADSERAANVQLRPFADYATFLVVDYDEARSNERVSKW